MANTLVKAMTGEWKPDKFQDEYREALLKLIEQKARSGTKTLPSAKTGQKAAPDKIIDLAALLKQSLSQSAKAGRKTRHRSVHKKAA